MTHLHWLEYAVRVVVRNNRDWMASHLLLAAVPAVLALVLFRPGARARLGAAWWCGLALFVAFLPNAPYVMNDVTYLRDLASGAGLGAAVTGVVPMFLTYLLTGLLLYRFAVRALVAEIARVWPRVRSWSVAAVAHVAAAVGIELGRVPRLNSWNAFDAPRATLRLGLATLATPGARLQAGIFLASITVSYAGLGAAGRVLSPITRRRLAWIRACTGRSIAPAASAS